LLRKPQKILGGYFILPHPVVCYRSICALNDRAALSVDDALCSPEYQSIDRAAINRSHMF